MMITDGLNPFRLHTLWFDNEFLLQIEDDDSLLTVTKSKTSKRAKSKCIVLWEGLPANFIKENDSDNLRGAFKNFIYSLQS